MKHMITIAKKITEIEITPQSVTAACKAADVAYKLAKMKQDMYLESKKYGWDK